MKLKMSIVDAFADKLFKGNQAAVIVLERWLDEKLMQDIAAENNLSETAFLVKEKNDIFNIRWFSPLCEIDFCGHATLASAFILFKEDQALTSIKFYAKAVGNFEVYKKDDGLIQMNFPKREPAKVQEFPNELLEGLSIKPNEIYKNVQAYFAVYEKEEDVLKVEYKSELLKKLAPYDVVVTSASKNREYDFVSRYFWPASGGKEDPVTGSIHAGLTPFWANKLNKNILVALQASKRTGVLFCELKEDRVLISGKAVQYLEGNITV